MLSGDRETPPDALAELTAGTGDRPAWGEGWRFSSWISGFGERERCCCCWLRTLFTRSTTALRLTAAGWAPALRAEAGWAGLVAEAASGGGGGGLALDGVKLLLRFTTGCWSGGLPPTTAICCWGTGMLLSPPESLFPMPTGLSSRSFEDFTEEATNVGDAVVAGEDEAPPAPAAGSACRGGLAITGGGTKIFSFARSAARTFSRTSIASRSVGQIQYGFDSNS